MRFSNSCKKATVHGVFPQSLGKPAGTARRQAKNEIKERVVKVSEEEDGVEEERGKNYAP